MKYRKFGSLDWEVSALGLGAMRLPAKGILRRPDEKKSLEMIRYAIDQGINYIDTAYMYGAFRSENVVGMALKDGYRNKVLLATKLPTMMCRKEEDFDKYLKKQMEKLDVDYLDLYLFHHLNRNEIVKIQKFDYLKKMEKAKDEGLIGGIGFSFHDTLPVFKDIIDMYDWDMAQIQYNYMDAGIQATTEGLKYGHEKGVAMVIMEPVKGGQLANPPKEALDVMKKSSSQRTPVDWALQYLWNLPEVTMVLSGMGNKKMVSENCSSADNSGTGSLTIDELNTIDQLANIYRNKILVPCTACKYCMPCPSGVNIPQNFAVLNNKALTGANFNGRLMQWLVTRRYKQMAKNEKELEKKPSMGNASVCTKCNVCISKCPQSINIPVELEKVNSILGNGKKIRDIYPETK